MKYAYIDLGSNSRVLGWIDTEEFNYVLPDLSLLVEIGVEGFPLNGDADLMWNGSVFVPYVPLPYVMSCPSTCTPAQGLVSLFALKEITEEDVLAVISRIADPLQQYTARIGYQRATTWERSSTTMQAMARLLCLSEKDMDELFSYAVMVQV